MSQFAIQMRQISKSYNGFLANKKVNFNLKKGTIHAIAGENGAGKSTLMKILFGLEQYDAAESNSQTEIFVNGQKKIFKSPMDSIAAGIGMVQQHFALSGVISALDNIILGSEPSNLGIINKSAALDKIKNLAGNELALPWDETTKNLAVGLQQRIEILKLLFRNAEILILDEPTGVLTPQEVELFFKLLRRLKAEGRSIIIITHKLEEIFSLCDEVTVLRQGEVTTHAEISSFSKDKLIEAMIGRKLKPHTLKASAALNKNKNIIKTESLSVPRKGRGSLTDVSIQIHPGEIVGIAGVEGNGQQALVEALMGLTKYSGKVFVEDIEVKTNKKNMRKDFNFGLISEDRHNQSLWLDQSIRGNCLLGISHRFSKFGIIQKSKSSEFSSDILKSYEVKMQSLEQPVRALSGGNQQKIVIAREVKGRNPKFLIASQPTRGVDVGAIEAIHDSITELSSKGSGVLLISSELEEVCKLSDRVIVLYEGKITGEFTGPNYDLQKLGAAMTGKGVHN